MRCLVPVALGLMLLLSACSARVTGMTNPVPHDYAPVEWRTLAGEVRQPFLVGPGYSAAFENDPQTNPEELIERYEALPSDAADGELVELRVGARPEDEELLTQGAWIGLRYAPERDRRFPERDAVDWPADELWLPELADGLVVEQSFLSPYPNLDGVTVRTATFWGDLTPGEGVVGPEGATVYDSPYLLNPLATLAAGERVAVSGSTEGYAAAMLASGISGYVSLAAFTELPAPGRTVAGPLVLEVLDEQGALVRSAAVERIYDNAHLDLRFAPLEESQGRRYTLCFSMPNATPNSAAALRASGEDVYVDGQLHVAGQLEQGDLIFQPLFATDGLLFEAELATLPRDGDWAIIEQPPALASGTIAEIVLWQPEPPFDWEYGVTPGRAPYGGWLADSTSILTEDDGAILFQGVYERDVPTADLLRDAVSDVGAALRDDTWFAIFYVGLGVIVVGALALLLIGPRRAERVSDGR